MEKRIGLDTTKKKIITKDMPTMETINDSYPNMKKFKVTSTESIPINSVILSMKITGRVDVIGLLNSFFKI